MSRGFKVLIISLILVTALAVWLFLAMAPRHSSVAEAPAEPGQGDPQSPTGAAPKLVFPKDIPRAANPDDPNLPIIDAISVEKTEVCRGEENFVNLKVHTRNGTDAFLLSRFKDPIDGQFIMAGNRIPFRLNGPVTDPMTVTIEGNMVSQTVAVPSVRVKDCDAANSVNIRIVRTMAVFDRVRLIAEITNKASDGTSAPFIPTTYEWDFGDGEKQAATIASVDHSYEGREQNVRQSSFQVAVTVKDRNGLQAHGSTVVSFPNPAFGRLYFKNEVTISIGVKEVEPGSTEHEKIWLYHGYNKPVHIEKAFLVEKVSANGETRETLRRAYPPQELLGLDDVSPKQSMTLRDLTDLQPKNPGSVRYVELEGRTSDGKFASGSFSLLARPEVPTNGHELVPASP
jgi:hypothetical protein